MGARTKGYIKNRVTGEIRKFQYNPTKYEYEMRNDIVALHSPGLKYPVMAYSRGDSITPSFSLFFHGKDTEDNIHWLENLMSPTAPYEEPPRLLVAMGTDIRECYLAGIGVQKELFDDDLKCIQAQVSISIVEVKNNVI